MAKPRLFSVTPYAWQRGQEIEVAFHGQQLSGVHQLLDYQHGITVHDWHVDDAKVAKARISIASDADLGAHALRLCTSAGITDLRLVSVVDQPTVDEQEPNNSLEQSQSIPRHAVINGRLNGNNSDWYALEAGADERISIELFGIRLGRAMLDAELRVFDPDGTLVAESDDTLLTKQDPFVSFSAAVAGSYRICVREFGRGGQSELLVRLARGFVPAAGAGHTQRGSARRTPLEVTWHFADGTTTPDTVSLPAPAELPTHDRVVARVIPSDDAGAAPSTVPLLLSHRQHCA